ncbi:hypothetical protein LZ554_001901 [Drepanopeziza brunnea f. sp. 'monogermtubi']|nr:hypothetical protein LZ554_001901 [Drepanopeziza brunnea f. sp. 'monogermtubi']
MFLVANELEWKRAKSDAFHSSVYSRDVIRLLQERIDDPIKAISDASIGAVATLASIDVIAYLNIRKLLLTVLQFGKKNVVMMKMHLNGLERMVSLRGGILKIRNSSPIVASVIHDVTDQLSLSARYLDLDTFDIARMVSETMLEARYICAKVSLPVPRVFNVMWPVNSILQRLLHMKLEDEGSYSANLTDACRYATCMFLFLPFNNQTLPCSSTPSSTSSKQH